MADLNPPETFKFTGAKFLDDIQKICTVIVRLFTSNSAMIFRQIVTLFPGLTLLQTYSPRRYRCLLAELPRRSDCPTRYIPRQ